MWARKRIDLGWRHLLAAAGYALFPEPRASARQSAERTWPGSDDVIACLSVRSGLDLMLGELNLTPGSEVLVSAVTLADMVKILRHHGLVAIPIDVNPADMSPRLQDIDQAITPRTKAILIAHLFGTRVPMDSFAEKAGQHGLLLWEDCAQAFDGRYAGHPQADAVMFSFGPIKTATALGGGLLRVRDRDLLARMRAAQEIWPLSSNRSFAMRAAKYAILKVLSGRIVLRFVMAFLKWRDLDPDRVLNGTVRNFPGQELIRQLRRRPATAMLQLLAGRLRTFDRDRFERQAQLGRRLADRLAFDFECPGIAAGKHSFWVFPICVRESGPVLHALRTAGFDASAGSQMRAVADVDGSTRSTPTAARLTSESVFLPLYPEMTDKAVDRLANVLIGRRQVLSETSEPFTDAA